jgi:NAD(P)-dependent dehydrogenase (short-subunit alcohol dehydrogenase family)
VRLGAPPIDDARRMSAPRRGVLITGASGGIGRATALGFAARGDRVAVHFGRDRASAEATLALLPGAGHAIVQADLADPDAARALVDDAVGAVGELDVLVNNAAAAPSGGNVHRPDDGTFEDWAAAWQLMVQVNLLGAAHASWAFARHLIAREAPGAIVNVGSRGAFRGEADHPAYAATKAALHALGQSLALALAPHGISVTSVAPGFVSTDRQQSKLAGASGAALRSESPFGRVASPDDVAAAILHLASPEARWSSGAVLDVNGASYLRT